MNVDVPEKINDSDEHNNDVSKFALDSPVDTKQKSQNSDHDLNAGELQSKISGNAQMDSLVSADIIFL